MFSAEYNYALKSGNVVTLSPTKKTLFKWLVAPNLFSAAILGGMWAYGAYLEKKEAQAYDAHMNLVHPDEEN